MIRYLNNYYSINFKSIDFIFKRSYRYNSILYIAEN